MAKPKVTTEGKPRKKRVQAKPSLSKVIREKQLKKLDEIKARVETPQLNTIGTPSGIQRQKGKKKGKRFVNEDVGSLLAIVAEVNEKTQKDIQSKLQRARELETIREAKRKENQARTESKKAKLEEKGKELLRKKKAGKGRSGDDD